MLKYLIKDARRTEYYFNTNNIPSPTLILTSPPYYDIKNYNDSTRQVGYGQTYEKYLSDITDIFMQCYRISSDKSSLWIVVDSLRKNGNIVALPFDIVRAITQGSKWIFKEIIIWDKVKNSPWYTKGRFKNQFEYILLFVKSDKYKFNIDRLRSFSDLKKWYKSYPERYNSKGTAPTNIWEFKIPLRGWGNGYQNHLCPLPFPLIERIIKLSTDENDMVFDPFAGSGSVIALASCMNRKALGFDLVKEYKNKFNKEVLIGAKKYYSKSQEILVQETIALDNYHQENIHLRKIKAGIDITQLLKKKIKNKDLRYILENTSISTVKLYLVLESTKMIKNHEEYFVEISKYIKSKYKIDITFQFNNYEEISTRLKQKYLVSYSALNIYEPQEKMKIQDVFNGKGNSKLLYSTMRLKQFVNRNQ